MQPSIWCDVGAVSDQPGHCRVFRFAVAWPRSVATQAKRIRLVAEYVGGWLDSRVVRERPDEGRYWLEIEVRRPLDVAVAEAIARGCPHHVAGTLAAGGG